MKRQLFLHLLVICLIIQSAIAQTRPERVPYRIYDNFDTHEMYSWEPYPYQQDTGYDPNFTVKKEPAYGDKGSSLFRTTRPNDANDLTQGFTKRIDLYSLGSTRVKFVFFMMSDRKPEKIDVSLGTFDGRLFSHTISSPKVNTWVEVDLPLDAFIQNGNSLTAGEHLQVVVMQASYPVVSHLLNYSIFMDEFSINGERPRQFIAQSPKSTWFEHFGSSALHRHYAPGETLAISVVPEGGIKLKDVSADLISPDGQVRVKNVKFYDDGSHGDSNASDGIWSNDAIYTIKATDLRGQWNARFTGASASPFSWDIGFIVPVTRLTADSHPRIFFTAPELAARRLAPEPEAAKKLLDNFINAYRPSTTDIEKLLVPSLEAPESVTGGPYASASMGGWFDTQNALARIINNEAWQFSLSGNKEAGERAKVALLKLCSLPTWNHPWMEANGNHTYYPIAPAASAAGVGYDLLNPILSQAERVLIRKTILENAVKPFYRDMVEMNRMPSSNSNHIGVILSGIGIATLAIADDDPELPGLEPYFSGILAKAKTFMDRTLLPEGSYNEPYTYQEFGYREFVEVLYSLEKNYGIDYTSTTHLKDFYIYPLYVTQNNRGKYQDLGDVSPTYNLAAQPSQWLVYKMKDPYMYKYVKPVWEAGNARGGIMPYLWYTEGITPIDRETLPTSKHFEGKGHMVMRSDWNDSGSILIYKAGPNGNHYHYDQGTLLLTHNGEELLTDAGHSSSYYANLYFPGYYTQAIGHNVMLVDMNAESQAVGDFANGIASLKNYPKITQSFAGEISDAVSSDLTSVYKGKVSSYSRSIISTKNGPIFLFDEVKSPEAHSYNWLFHAEHTNGQSSIAYSDNRMTITRPAARLTMDVISPEALSSRIRTSDRSESFIALSSEKVKEATFLGVMVPEGKPGSGEFQNRPKAMPIDKQGWIGAHLKDEKISYYGLFKVNANADGNLEGFTTDALRFTAALQGDKLSKAYFEGSSFEGYGIKVKSSAPVAAAISVIQASTDLEVKSEKEIQLSFSISSKPSKLLLNGSASKNWKFDQKSGMVTVNLPAGQSKISVNKF